MTHVMSDKVPGRHVHEGEVLPPSHESRRTLEMPAETPFGLGFLGEARFDAIRRVIEARQRTLRAIEAHIDAEADVDRALVRRAISLDQLRNVGSYVQHANNEAEELAFLGKLHRELERVKLEEQIAQVRARTNGSGAPPKANEKPDDYKAFVDVLTKMPGVVEATRKAKEDIIAQAGGEDRLTDEDRDLLAAIDQMLQEFIAKQGEGAR